MNQRITLTDGSGRWFSPKASSVYEEGSWWDGSNPISRATGSQWHHERLYRTKSGRWIKRWWSCVQGEGESYREISNEEAAKWLVENGHDPHPSCADEYAALEIS